MRIRLMTLALTALTLLLPCTVAAKVICKKPTTLVQLKEAGDRGEKAFSDMDKTTLLSVASRAREETLPCLKETVTTSAAAGFHRLMALAAFMRRDKVRVTAEFHAARKLEPGYKFPDGVFGPQHPLRKLYGAAALYGAGINELVYPPPKGYVMVGGVRNAPRSSNVPVIVQVFNETGLIIETRYFKPGETLPNWGKVNPLGVTARDLGIDTRSIWTKPEGYYISAAVLAVLAGTFYGLSMMEKGKFEDRSTPDGDLAGHRTRANGFGYTSIATGGLALILTGVGVGIHVHFGGSDSPKVRTSTQGPLTFGAPRFGEGFGSTRAWGGGDVRF